MTLKSQNLRSPRRNPNKGHAQRYCPNESFLVPNLHPKLSRTREKLLNSLAANAIR